MQKKKHPQKAFSVLDKIISLTFCGNGIIRFLVEATASSRLAQLSLA